MTEVEIIEPPVVAREAADLRRNDLLDSHLRVGIMGERGEAEIVCLVATFTYNKRVSRIVTIQEHRMILNAVRKGCRRSG
jgi:hypothetical protein